MYRIPTTINNILMALGVLFVALCVVVLVSLLLFPESTISKRIQAVTESDPQPHTPQLSEGIYDAFRVSLQSEVRSVLGTPIEGYEPSMFMHVFPGLSETDFEGVEASIGFYTIAEGRLVHKLDNSRLIHSAAGAITNRGMDTLLENVSKRLHVDLNSDGTLTKIMDALVFEETALPKTLEEPVACTLEAKICPDGSAVGRVGPSCEFAPCP